MSKRKAINENGYVIHDIKKDGTVIVTFDIDDKEQTLLNMPIDHPDVLRQALSEYLHGYRTGLELNSAPVDKSVSDLIGEKQQADTQEA